MGGSSGLFSPPRRTAPPCAGPPTLATNGDVLTVDDRRDVGPAARRRSPNFLANDRRRSRPRDAMDAVPARGREAEQHLKCLVREVGASEPAVEPSPAPTGEDRYQE